MKDSTSVALSMRFIGIFAFCILAIAIPAQAVTVYSTGFETTTFSTGNLHGQDSWQASTWHNGPAAPNGVDVTPSIQTGTVANGTQAVKIPLNDVINSETEAAWRTFTGYSTTDNIITITQNVYFSANDENSFEIELSGSNDVVTNYVTFYSDGEIYVNDDAISTGHSWTAGDGNWKSLKIVMDFDNELTDVYYNSTQIADDVAFLATGGFERYLVWSLEPFWYGSEMYLDDLNITAVPEPTCLVLLGLGSACLVRRRKS